MVQFPFSKRKTSWLKLNGNVSFQDYVDMLGDDDCDASHQKKIRREVNQNLNAEGPCGKILRSMRIPMENDDEDYEWHFLHPCALLRELCKLCPLLGDLILENGGPRLAIYMDEIKPGNVLRPDPSRTVACWYWTFMNLPTWFQTRKEGWFYFGCFPTKLLHKVVGGHSYLFGRVLEHFLEKEDPLNFTIGFPCKSTKGTFLCQAKLAAVLSDEKSLKELWSLRGASGTKPCCLCQNIIGHMPQENLHGHEWLLHYSCSDRARFARHTPQTFQAMRDSLALAVGNKKELNRLGQVYGLQYTASGILWHPTLKDLVCPVKQTYYDWMHVLVASGGVAQYEVNELVKKIRGAGIRLKILDEFASNVLMPKSRPKLPSTFFQDRINDEDNSCIRGFAAEMLTCIPILALFNDTILEPTGLLSEHVLCFRYLATIMDILGKNAVNDLLPQLRRYIDDHGLLFQRLYPQCVKPKYHWLFHLPENIEDFKVNMSCFSPERKHRAVKTIAAHVFNEHLGHNITLRIGYETLKAFDSQETICRAVFLKEPIREITGGAAMLSFWSDEIVGVRTARSLMTPTGMISLKDMVFAPSLSQLFVPCAFLEVIFMTGKKEFIVQANCHSWKTGCLFEALPEKSLLLWELDFRPVVYTYRSCGSIHACLQTIDQECLRLAQT